MEESFTYDGMDRLTGITLKRRTWQDLHCSVSYDALGRMTSRQASPSFPSAGMDVTYTGFDKVSRVRQGSDSLHYVYGFDRERIRMEEFRPEETRTKDYVGSCEFITKTTLGDSVSHSLTFVSGPCGVFAVVQNHPSYITNKNLQDMGVSDMTAGELYGSYNGSPGYRNTYYTWTDSEGNPHHAEVFSVILAQSLGIPLGTITEGVEMAAKSYQHVPLLKIRSGLTHAQKVAALSKEDNR